MTTQEPSDQSLSSNPASTLLAWVVRIVSVLGVLVCLAAGFASGGALLHGHPMYLVLLAVVFLASSLVAIRAWRTEVSSPRRHLVLRTAGALGSVLVFASVWWLAPYSALEPAHSAMVSDHQVTVTETATRIVLEPVEPGSHLGVFFQPGARVDARAYTAVLRPLAENGHTVVIPKQPLGIGFLATNAFAAVRSSFDQVESWVVGGHSLGGVVASNDAEAFHVSPGHPVRGLLLFASYPVTDLSGLSLPVLSISGSGDGLATPQKIEASTSSLPVDTGYLEITGGIHSFFGDYGMQNGDGSPEISRDQARQEISRASVDFAETLGR
ncbi:alpha/beta hydrolase [Glutamicibacter sp. MNS18]|uniref:alpha/beta hydrolase n=1 Tax=Glutamicibacter sp. MNS18 TaxID=2989817 RepID=UPI0022364B71|nr:alpha/beta hydrolase [Glutamicibacter sp. MNS18]MCW4466810.1 alpha/beta hydrolase [Glutamicibacter sp. MNS18]